MGEFRSGELVARLAPGLIAHFRGRALLDFQVLRSDRSRLRVVVDFSGEPGHWSDLEVMSAVAAAAGVCVRSAGTNRSSAWMEVSMPVSAECIVVPFRTRQAASAQGA